MGNRLHATEIPSSPRKGQDKTTDAGGPSLFFIPKGTEKENYFIISMNSQ